MRPHDEPHGLCSVDPISLTGLALASLAGAGTAAATSLVGGGGSSSTTATPTSTETVQPIQAISPTTNKPTQKSATPTFVGASAVPNQTAGQKTLLGQ